MYMSHKNYTYLIITLLGFVAPIKSYPRLLEHHTERPFFYDEKTNYFKEHIFTGGNQ